MNSYFEKLSLLRASMKGKNIDFYLIPSSDPHLGEYIPEHWRLIQWLTGFTGSAGTLVITGSFAGLWTDSRYFIQAEKQLSGSGFILVKPDNSNKNDILNWIQDNIDSGGKIALDGRIFSIDRTRQIAKALETKNISYDFNCDLISELWIDRPPLPVFPAFEHAVKFCGKERSVKIAEVREQMRIKGADFHLLTSPDDIMWLLNIRGSDIKYSPLVISFAVVDQEQILLFAEEGKFPLRLASEFDKLGIVILPYEEAGPIISTLTHDSTILLNPSTTSAAIFNSIPVGMNIIEEISIPTLLKAIKNKVEIENIAKAMIKDGIALTRFFFWLSQNSETESLSVTEVSAGDKLSGFRAESENYLGPSFSPIVAYNHHAALPHYSATIDSDVAIGEDGILLVDSGGQYLDGTTDITRTISLGAPTIQQKTDFTLILKGTISLAMAKFPVGTKGSHLDILARKALWNNGLNYGHGTGHGVGFCLNVHEGPQNIGPGSGPGSQTVLEPGMLISDEPALYREGEYGIRIENLVLCYEDEETEFGKFLKFDTVSLCYIEKSLIDFSLLDKKEIDWLNSYHADVFEKLSPHLSEEVRVWLKEKTSQF
jgi:Xaa-Pro aminopeptidase